MRGASRWRRATKGAAAAGGNEPPPPPVRQGVCEGAGFVWLAAMVGKNVPAPPQMLAGCRQAGRSNGVHIGAVAWRRRRGGEGAGAGRAVRTLPQTTPCLVEIGRPSAGWSPSANAAAMQSTVPTQVRYRIARQTRCKASQPASPAPTLGDDVLEGAAAGDHGQHVLRHKGGGRAHSVGACGTRQSGGRRQRGRACGAPWPTIQMLVSCCSK